MKFITFINLVSSILFVSAGHPVMFMTIILIQTILICLMVWLKLSSTWFSYILFLIFLGGLMVLFIYITSLASNEKFNFSLNMNMNLLTLSTILLFTLIYFNYQEMLINFSSNKIMFMEMYSLLFLFLTMMTMIYLLITLIVVVKMTSKFKGPLRNLIF